MSNKSQSELNLDYFYSTVKLEVTFCDQIGNILPIFGTAFWVKTSDKSYLLITNRHNIDPGTKNPEYKDYKLVKLKVQIRYIDTVKKSVYEKISFIEPEVLEGSLHTSADVAIIHFSFDNIDKNIDDKNIDIKAIPYANIASDSFIRQDATILDTIAFIGFPESWYDQKTRLPIARMANLASYTGEPYINKAIKTSDVLLVSGLSFGGSSGSPVIFSKGNESFRVGSYEYIAPTIIGIMSGRCNSLSDEPGTNLPAHSGLSYFTKSSAIHEVLQHKNTEAIKNYIASPDIIQKYIAREAAKKSS